MYYSLKQKKILERKKKKVKSYFFLHEKKNTSYTGLVISMKDRIRVIGISNNPF